MSTSNPHLHDIINTSDHLLDISSEHESMTHHPSLLSAYESELQFDESTYQHETEPYMSQVADSSELHDVDGTSVENFATQSDRGDNSHADHPHSARADNTDISSDKANIDLEDEVAIKAEDRMFSSSPIAQPANLSAESEEEDELNNPYSSYQQFHRELSTHDDPKSELLEFETLEQENTDTATPEIELAPLAGQLGYITNADDVPSYDSLKEYLRQANKRSREPTNSKAGRTATNGYDSELGVIATEHKSRKDKWADNSSNDVTNLSNQSKSRWRGRTSPSRLPTSTGGQRMSPTRSRPLTPSSIRSKTPTGIPTMRKSKSQSLARDRSPSATRRSPADLVRSGRRSVSADNSLTPSATRQSGMPSPLRSQSPSTNARRYRNMSGSQIPRSRPLTPSSSLRSLERQSSEEPRSEFSETTGSSRPPSRLPRRSQMGGISQNQNPSRSSVEPRRFQNNSNRPSRLPSARPSVTSATELTSQDEQSPDLDLSSGDEEVSTGQPVHINDSMGAFLVQPNNSINVRNPPSSETQPLSTTHADTHDQVTSMDDKSATEESHSPKLRTTKITKTMYDYEEIETTKTTTRILATSSPQQTQSPAAGQYGKGDNSPQEDQAKLRSRSQNSQGILRRGGGLVDRRALSEDRKATYSPSQFGEAKALNDAIRQLEARETKETKSSTGVSLEKSSWSPTLPDDLGDNSRPMSSTWTSLAEYNQTEETKASTTVRADDISKERPLNQKKAGEGMPRTSHTHLPGSVNHAHYALPTTSYLSNIKSKSKGDRYQASSRRDSSSSDLPQETKRRSPRKKRGESDQAGGTRSKLDQSDATLDPGAKENETESEELVRQLQTDFDDLLSKYAMAEVTIDQLRLGAKLNLYSDPAQPSQATIMQPGTARSATMLSLPQKGQVSLNSSLQSAALGYNFPGMSPRQASESGILTTAPAKPLSNAQRALKENVLHLQDQVASFIAGVTGEGRVLNLKPEIHHQLYEALEQSQDTLHHQLSEEKRDDPSFDEDNHLAGQLHQIRMCMDDHIDKLPQIQQPPRITAPVNRYNSDEETASHTPSSLATGHSGSTATQRLRRSAKKGSRKDTPRGSKGTPSYTEHSSSAAEDILTDEETVRPKSHHPDRDGTFNNSNKPQSKTRHRAASGSSVAGSDHIQGLKSAGRVHGSSDSGFIGSEEGKSPNTPSDRHLSGLPTIQSQAENSGIDSPRALTPDLSESRTAEWALRHKVPIEVGSEPVLPDPPKHKRTQSRSSRKSVRSDRSGQSSLRSEALRSIKSEIEQLRDDFNRQQGMSPVEGRLQPAAVPKQTYGSPMRATYQLPAGYRSPTAPRPQAANNKTDGRNSDLDLSEVEGGRGYTPAPPPQRRDRTQDYYPSADEDPRVPPKHSDQRNLRAQQPSMDHRPPNQRTEQRSRDPESTHREPANRHREAGERPVKPEHLDVDPVHRPRDSRQRHADYEPSINEREEMTLRDLAARPSNARGPQSDPREFRSSSAEEKRRPAKEYSPGRAPSSLYDYSSRPQYRDEAPSPGYRSDNRPQGYQSPAADRGHREDRPSSGRSARSYYDEPDYNHPGQKLDLRGQRSGYRGEMSPISEQAHAAPEREYYRQYKSPLRRSRSFHDERTAPRGYSQTMDELNTRDLNQSTLPVDSTVYTNQANTPHIAPPNAVSTPYYPQGSASQPFQPSRPTYQPPQSFQPQQPLQHSGQSQQPLVQTNNQLHIPSQTFSQPRVQYQPQVQQPVAQFHQSVPVPPVAVQPPIYQPPIYQPPAVTALPVQQTGPVQMITVPTATFVPGLTTTATYQACPSCSGRGVLAATHNCASCGSHLQPVHDTQLTTRVTPLQLSNQTPVMVTNQRQPVVIPVTNENEAYLTQRTSEGYVTQSVNVVEAADAGSQRVIRSHSVQTPSLAIPVIETSPSGKVRYYVREYGATSSDGEPSRSKSFSRRTRHRSRERHGDSAAVESMDDLETSLREARRSAESLKRLSQGMRDGLQDELSRSLNRRSLSSSWML